MPRKTAALVEPEPGRPVASMRPRPDAAENQRRAEWYLYRMPASMRPRPDAAENPEAKAREETAAVALQ